MPSILGSGGLFGGGLSILSVARANSSVGLSSRARAMTNDFLSKTNSYGNSMFSAGAGAANLTVEQLQTQIKALRASMPAGKVAPGLRDESYEPVTLKTGKVGSYVDTRA
jgi:hypothetical protein